MPLPTALMAAWFALASAPAPVAGPATSLQFARATPPGGGALLYREQHLLRSEGGSPRERLVMYRCADGRAFARKRVDYSASATAPDFALEDARFGYREGMQRRAGGVALYARERSGAAEVRTALAAAPGVADAGFDEFVRANWTALAADQGLPLRFAVPARGEAMDFRVRRVGAVRVDGIEAQRFRLRLEGLLGFVAPHIDVDYDARSRRLLRFEGLANLRDPRNAGQWRVRIDFPEGPRPAPPGAWTAAAAESLVRHCESGQQADSPAARTPVALR